MVEPELRPLLVSCYKEAVALLGTGPILLSQGLWAQEEPPSVIFSLFQSTRFPA